MNRICTSRESGNHPTPHGTGMFPELLFPESSPSELAEELWEPSQVRVLGDPVVLQVCHLLWNSGSSWGPLVLW